MWSNDQLMQFQGKYLITQKSIKSRFIVHCYIKCKKTLKMTLFFFDLLFIKSTILGNRSQYTLMHKRLKGPRFLIKKISHLSFIYYSNSKHKIETVLDYVNIKYNEIYYSNIIIVIRSPNVPQ